jgi:hypothetical protein
MVELYLGGSTGHEEVKENQKKYSKNSQDSLRSSRREGLAWDYL